MRQVGQTKPSHFLMVPDDNETSWSDQYDPPDETPNLSGKHSETIQVAGVVRSEACGVACPRCPPIFAFQWHDVTMKVYILCMLGAC